MPPPPAAPDRTAATTGARLAAESREDAVRARFVRELLAAVPLVRVAEVYLFAPMRQGSVESAVAVVAARQVDAADPTDGDEAHASPVRHTVYTARYRLTVRGPDRGRWQLDVREEADAPLVTVEAVVRGVQRRAGDASAPARLGAAALAELVAGAPAATQPQAAI